MSSNQSFFNVLKAVKIPCEPIMEEELAMLLQRAETVAELNGLDMIPSAELTLSMFKNLNRYTEEKIRISGNNVTANLLIDVKKSFSYFGEVRYVVTHRIQQR